MSDNYGLPHMQVHPNVIYSAYDTGALVKPRVIAGYDHVPQESGIWPVNLNIETASGWDDYISPIVRSVPHTISGFGMLKQTPETIVVWSAFPSYRFAQCGAPNLRLNWPLAYDIPGTEWRLTFVTETNTPVDDDGVGPNPPTYFHVNQWVWRVDGSISSLKRLLQLYRDVPIGASECPLISDEALYTRLQGYLDTAQECLNLSDMSGAVNQLILYEDEVMDSIIFTVPSSPAPGGLGTGIFYSDENPVAMRLLVEVEYILLTAGTNTEAVLSKQPERKTTSKPMPSPAVPATTGIQSYANLVHPTITVPTASPASSGSTPVAFMGHSGMRTGTVALPGVLGILPGENWSNFIAAAQHGVPYTLQYIRLMKETAPVSVGYWYCVFPEHNVSQAGTANCRLWWPLLYETPGTLFTVGVYYQTNVPCRFPGEDAASTTHQEIWTIQVNDDLNSLNTLVGTMHGLPFGNASVPLISDEMLYSSLGSKLDSARSCLADGDLLGMRDRLDEFEAMTSDACITVAPCFPNPAGPGTGIACTEENPACCKLIVTAHMLQSSQQSTLADATKLCPDTVAVAITQPQVATTIADDWFYVQDQGRANGLKVIGSIDGLQPGAELLLRGIMGTSGPERVMDLVGSEITNPYGSLPRSLAILNSRVGGSGCGLIPGFQGAFGLWNGGLLITIVGRVSDVASDHFYINDGSISSGAGLRVVLLPGVTPPSPDSYVRATGISAWFDAQSRPEPAVIINTSTDLITIQTE